MTDPKVRTHKVRQTLDVSRWVCRGCGQTWGCASISAAELEQQPCGTPA